MRLIDRWQDLVRRRRPMQGLEDLNDNILRDIGLDRRSNRAEIARLLTDSQSRRI